MDSGVLRIEKLSFWPRQGFFVFLCEDLSFFFFNLIWVGKNNFLTYQNHIIRQINNVNKITWKW